MSYISKPSKQVSIYSDLLLVEAFLKENNLVKTADAGTVTYIVNLVKQYFDNHMDKTKSPAANVIDMLGPGIAWKLFGGGILGGLVAIIMEIFHVNVSDIWEKIANQIKPLVESGQKLSTEKVMDMSKQIVDAHTSSENKCDDFQYVNANINKRLKKLALFDFRMIKARNILSTVLGLIFSVILAAGGFMVFGDIINKFLDRPSALSGNIKQQEEQTSPTPVSVPEPTQQKFKKNPSYTPENYNSSGYSVWIENIPNNHSSIENMLIDFSKDVYQDINGHEQIFKSAPAFQTVAENIEWYNHNAGPSSPMVFIPKMFTNKKMIVDLFIDQAAAKA